MTVTNKPNRRKFYKISKSLLNFILIYIESDFLSAYYEKTAVVFKHLISGIETRSREDCLYKCERNLVEKKFNCTPNPFSNRDFNLIDIKSLKLDFCIEQNLLINKKQCEKLCKKECSTEYFDLSFSKDYTSLTQTDKPLIILKSRNLPNFRYNFEAKYSFANYMSNIGGIISFWFGWAVIDFSIIMKRIIRIIKIYYHFFMTDYMLEALRNIRIFKLLSKVLEFVGKSIYRLEFFNWKLWLKIVCIPCLLYQIFEITQNYLNFSTNVNVELVPLLDNNFISTQRIPAITLCHENILRHIFFDETLRNFDKKFKYIYYIFKQVDKNNFDMDLHLEIETKIQLTKNQKILLRFYQTVFKKEFPNQYKQIMVFIMKYLENNNYKSLIINNSTIFDEMKFFSNHFSCYLGINQSLNCSEVIEIKPTLSHLGNCNTYLFK